MGLTGLDEELVATKILTSFSTEHNDLKEVHVDQLKHLKWKIHDSVLPL